MPQSKRFLDTPKVPIIRIMTCSTAHGRRIEEEVLSFTPQNKMTEVSCLLRGAKL